MRKQLYPLVPTTFCCWLLLLVGCAAAPLPADIPTDYDVIVVGAGMGGLSAATHLAKGGMKVLVLEQHDKVGGCTTSFTRGDFTFETALHEMALGGGDGVVLTLLQKAGVAEKVELIRVPELGRSIFPGVDIMHPDSREETVRLFSERWPEEAENIAAYHALLAQMHDEMIELRDLYLANPVRALLMKLTLPLRQRALFKYRNHTLQEVLDEFFESDELKAAVGQFWVYHGPPPSEQWALINMIGTYTYMLNGGWQFKGTSQALSNAYAERIVELGGEVRTATRVTRILVENEQVRGVEIHGGERFTSRYVVSNADPFQTFFKLIGEEQTPPQLATKIRSMKPSNSFAGVYMGLDVPLSHWGIEEYEICYNSSLDANAMYQAMMEGRYEDGLVMLTLYSNLPDPTYAPPGKSVVTLTTYSDISLWSADPEIYEEQKERMAEQLIAMAENVMPGLSEHIEVMETMSPRTIARYTWNHRGIPYGWSFTPKQQQRLPIPTPIGGLFMAGAWTWPSSSVSMTQLSGYLAARLILQEEDSEPDDE